MITRVVIHFAKEVVGHWTLQGCGSSNLLPIRAKHAVPAGRGKAVVGSLEADGVRGLSHRDSGNKSVHVFLLLLYKLKTCGTVFSEAWGPIGAGLSNASRHCERSSP